MRACPTVSSARLAAAGLLAALAAGPAAALCTDSFSFRGSATSDRRCTSFQLTPAGTGDAAVGAVWQRQRVDTSRSFSVRARFGSWPDGTARMGEGLTLTVQGAGLKALGAGGDRLGMVRPGVAVVLQTGSASRAGLSLDGTPDAVATLPVDAGAAAFTWGWFQLDYDAATQQLSLNATLWVNEDSYTVTETRRVNLAKRLGAQAVIGFTGANGAGQHALHNVTSYQFSQP